MERFWNKVFKTSGCWYWKASKRSGYGAFRFKGKIVSAHRFSYILTYGSIPFGKLVCHSCDNKICVNPSHLFLGSYRDNLIDSIQKGRIIKISVSSITRFLPGEKHPFHKLTDKQVASIRKEYTKQGVTLKTIAKKYHVDKSLIWQIIRRKIHNT